MSKSIMSNERVCYLCRSTYDLHKHHVLFGAGRRETAEKDGCWVYLCAAHHNMSNHSVHFDRALDRRLKAICQRKWEQKYGSREKFMARYGRNYIDD